MSTQTMIYWASLILFSTLGFTSLAFSAQTQFQGKCIYMTPPGSSKQLFTPCNRLGLQLLYEKDKKTIISLLRTDTDGKFSFSIPPNAPWRIVSASPDMKEQVDLIKNQDGSQKVVVILKPEGVFVPPPGKAQEGPQERAKDEPKKK